MSKIAFSTTPPMVWNHDANNKSILESMERLVSRARASDSSISHGEWHKYWKAVGEIMENSEPTEVCDPAKSGSEYLDSLISSLGGGAPAVERDVFKLNGTNQYISISPDTDARSFLLAMSFIATVGIKQPIMSNPQNSSYIEISASGDMNIQIDGNELITIPSNLVGDISTPRRLEVGRADRAVRVRIDGNDVFVDPDHGRGEFGAQYLGTNQSRTEFSDAVIYDVQFITRSGEHFYLINDISSTIVDSGVAKFDGTIHNHDPSGWTKI